jgi:hypothetical protein
MANSKAKKLKESSWQTPRSTILVLQLIDYTFDLMPEKSAVSLSDDFAQFGFQEIWLADHTEVEAFAAVRLIGLFPSEYWGTHDQASLRGKPYG